VNNSHTSEGALERGRELLRKQAWIAAFAELSKADSDGRLGAQDLLSLALVAHLLGREAENASLLARAHQAFQGEGNVRSAVRCAFWLGFSAMLNGDMAQANGWLGRARRLLDDCQQQMPEGCVEEGYLLLPVGYQSVHAGEADQAYTAFAEAAGIGERFGDKDLIALGRQGQGRALIRKGDITRGLALLDEVMIGVAADELSLNVAGGVYCSVIEACGEIFDIRRAQEWTTLWIHGAPPILMSFLIVDIAKSAVRRSCNFAEDGPRRLRLPIGRARKFRDRSFRALPDLRSTAWRSCTVYVATSKTPKPHIARRASSAKPNSPDWPCCWSEKDKLSPRWPSFVISYRP